MSNTLLADAVFWVSIATLVSGAYKFSLSELYKSKCHTFKLCYGLINVERNIQEEIKYDIEQIHQEQSKRNTIVNSPIDTEHKEEP